MRDKDAERAIRVRDPLDTRQGPRIGADLGQAASAKAVEDEGCVPPLTEYRGPPGFGISEAAAAVREDDGRKGPGSRRWRTRCFRNPSLRGPA